MIYLENTSFPLAFKEAAFKLFRNDMVIIHDVPREQFHVSTGSNMMNNFFNILTNIVFKNETFKYKISVSDWMFLADDNTKKIFNDIISADVVLCEPKLRLSIAKYCSKTTLKQIGHLSLNEFLDNSINYSREDSDKNLNSRI